MHTGQLGHGKFETCSIPKLVNIKFVRQIACGANHSACIVEPGQIEVGANYIYYSLHYTLFILLRNRIYMGLR